VWIPQALACGSFHGDSPLLSGFAVLDRYDDRIAILSKYPGIGYGAFLQVGSRVLDRVGAVAEGLDVAMLFSLRSLRCRWRSSVPLLAEHAAVVVRRQDATACLSDEGAHPRSSLRWRM